MKHLNIILVFIAIIILTGCNNENINNIVEYNDDYGVDTTQYNYTYKFIGVSKHFGFETGKVYYGDNNERYLYINNFKVLEEVKNIKSYSFLLSFNGESMISEYQQELDNERIEEALQNLLFEETGTHNPDGYGEIDAFTKTKREEFKKEVTVGIKYCLKNNKCETEYFDIQYMEQ